MRKPIIIAVLALYASSLFAIDTTRITIYPNKITGEINQMLFGSTSHNPVYDSTGYACGNEYYNEYYEFNSKRMAGLWDDSLDLPDTLFKELYKKANTNIISIETPIKILRAGTSIGLSGRARWQTLIGGDSHWRDSLYWDDQLYIFQYHLG